jgi:hypothetical protein
LASRPSTLHPRALVPADQGGEEGRGRGHSLNGPIDAHCAEHDGEEGRDRHSRDQKGGPGLLVWQQKAQNGADAGEVAAQCDHLPLVVSGTSEVPGPAQKIPPRLDAFGVRGRPLKSLADRGRCGEFFLKPRELVARRPLLLLACALRFWLRELVEDVCDQARPEVRIGVVPGVELDVADVAAVVGALRPTGGVASALIRRWIW